VDCGNTEKAQNKTESLKLQLHIRKYAHIGKYGHIFAHAALVAPLYVKKYARSRSVAQWLIG